MSFPETARWDSVEPQLLAKLIQDHHQRGLMGDIPTGVGILSLRSTPMTDASAAENYKRLAIVKGTFLYSEELRLISAKDLWKKIHNSNHMVVYPGETLTFEFPIWGHDFLGS